MKNKLMILAATFLAAACSLDKVPGDSIHTDESIQSIEDCNKFLIGQYSGLKYVTTGAYIYATELQTDLFHAVKNFGNFDGDFYHYSVTASNDLAEEAWYGAYHSIANINFLIEGIQKIQKAGNITDDENATLNEYYGEACFFRSYYYWMLAQYYCDAYETSTASTSMGVPVVLKYAPTGNSENYPSRGTLQQTYNQILADLEEAEKFVTRKGVSQSSSITTDVITAFKARVALGMKDYDTARIAAEAVIATKKYTLVSNATTYAEGWINDNLSETIFQLAMINSTEVGNAYSYFLYNSSGIEGRDNPQYIPEDWVLDLYDKNKDIRYAAYFDERTVTTPVVGKMTLLIKYPGNPKLYTKVTNYCNMPKVFRASEMYLIAAEAEYLSPNGSIAKANSYLNDLRKARIKGWSEKTYAGEALMSEIRNERVKELFCEGFRLSDLKRWHLGFTRSEGQDPSLIMQGENYATCTRPADDPQFLWPIPTSELEANPNMKDQQNPGYKMD